MQTKYGEQSVSLNVFVENPYISNGLRQSQEESMCLTHHHLWFPHNEMSAHRWNLKHKTK